MRTASTWTHACKDCVHIDSSFKGRAVDLTGDVCLLRRAAPSESTVCTVRVRNMPPFSAGSQQAGQDGGAVAENLRSPVQRGEDDAVRALHGCVRRLPDHQREGPRGSGRTG